MKRILLFNDTLELGGTEMLLVNMLDHLVMEGCEVTLLLPEESDQNILLERVPSSVTVRYLYKPNASRFAKKIGENLMIFCPSLFRRMKRIKSSDYDVVLCFKESFYARIFSGFKSLKIIWIHNIPYKRSYTIGSMKERLSVWLNKRHVALAQKCYTKFDKAICVSDACRDAYLNVVCGNRKVNQKIEIVYNAIDLSKVIEKSEESIVDLHQGITKFVLVTRNSPDKRVDRLIHAASRLVNEKYDFRVSVIGDGLDNQDMQAQIAGLGLEEKVYTLGRIQNPHPYVLQSNWALCVSERESFSLTLLEAMALKTPVITTNCGGPSDIIDNGRYGILVDNSTEGVYKGMKMVLDDASLSVKYSSNLDQALDRFNYDGWLSKIDQVLELHK